MAFEWSVFRQMKRCSQCDLEKPFSEFAFKNKSKETRASECKVCHRVARNKLYAGSPLPDQTRVRQRKVEIKQWVDDVRRQGKCQCGESHPGCLDFHHTDPLSKEISISKMAEQGWGRDRILKELEKCQVLCSNCHRKLHWVERQLKRK